ncbi:ATPase class I type 8B member 4 [Bonamia ostreae]|uniref:ATPase class I type 8B member 4 n=1 Tax=Bonamia ostreae TaxID=126728 RepID=A0ABV2ANE2_9EUKA
MEMTKLIHAFNINRDKEMRSNKKMAKTRSSNLTDEIGQVNVMFCDKTGTLTKNKMAFSCCSVRGKKFIDNFDQIEQTENRKNGKKLKKSNYSEFKNDFSEEKSRSYFSDSLKDLLKSGDKMANEFLTLLAVCHTVITEYPECDENGSSHEHTPSCKIQYQAESPDEKALLIMAKNHGYFCIVNFNNLNLTKFYKTLKEKIF